MSSLFSCPTCGRSVSENAKTCPKCGEPDVGEKARRYYHDFTVPEQKKRREEELRTQAYNERIEREHEHAEAEETRLSKRKRASVQNGKFLGALVGFFCGIVAGESDMMPGILSIVAFSIVGTIVGGWLGKRYAEAE